MASLIRKTIYKYKVMKENILHIYEIERLNITGRYCIHIKSCLADQKNIYTRKKLYGVKRAHGPLGILDRHQ